MSPIDTTTGLNQTIRMSSIGGTSKSTILDSELWTPVVTDGPTFAYEFFANGAPKPVQVSNGSITFQINHADFANLSWKALAFKGQPATVWVGKPGEPFASYRKLYTGPMGGHQSTATTCTVELAGCASSLVNSKLLSATYAGAGGSEGGSDLRGNFKPWTMGFCRAVEPIKIDAVNMVYQVSTTPCAIVGVYEIGYPIADAPKATVTNYADLIALTLKPGEYAVCPTQGMFRLGGNPNGDITADIGASSTTGAIIAAMLTIAGQGAKIGPSITASALPYDYFAREQESILEAVEKVALHAGGYLIADQEGVWHLGRSFSTRTPIAVDDKRSIEPLVRPDTITQEPVASPVWRVKVGHTHVYSTGEVSSALATIAADQQAFNEKAEELELIANQAKADAALSLARVEAQVLDSVLDRAEKLTVIQRFEEYTAERPGLLSEGANQGALAERSAYDAAYGDLKAYLEGLAPAWNNTTVDTTIDPTVYNARFKNYHTARQALVNANSREAAKKALWPNIPAGNGRPADNADVTGNNTARDTNAVAGTPSTTVITNITNAANTANTAATNASTALTRADQALSDAGTLKNTTIPNLNTKIDTAKSDLLTETGRIDGKYSGEVTRLDNRITSVSGGTSYDDAPIKATIESNKATAARDTGAVADRALKLEAQFRGEQSSEILSRLTSVQTTVSNGTFAAATDVRTLEAQMRGDTTSGLSSRIETRATAIADAKAGAVASDLNILRSSYNGTASEVGTLKTTVATVDGRTKAFLQQGVVAGNNRAQISLYADSNGGAGVDIVGDVTFRGNLAVGTGQTGQRVEISNSGMRVYDANNVIRVQIGIF